ncbi:DNA/RNA helicase domain-containing protein [Sphingobacterium yanglingense]|uniref:DNA/RNA helicase domain-containing protein n=1 Tax=Sphingobacterium yanglingense TaxID=1437280 RepID=UPI0037435586
MTILQHCVTGFSASLHTAQGLDCDYIGVIIGDDLIIRNGVVRVDPTKRDKDDRTILGWKKPMKANSAETAELLTVIRHFKH